MFSPYLYPGEVITIKHEFYMILTCMNNIKLHFYYIVHGTAVNGLLNGSIASSVATQWLSGSNTPAKGVPNLDD